MAADGSIIIETDIDNKKAQQELNRLSRKIQNLNDQIYTKRQQQMHLVTQSKQLAAELDSAKAKLESMKDGSEFYTSASIDAQEQRVKELQKAWDSVQNKVESYDNQIKKANISLDLAKQQTGAVQQQLAASASSGSAMAGAMDKASKSVKRFASRLKGVVASALVFTVISQALAAVRDWMGKVIKTNEEAQAAFARLKGALLTLAQPLVNVIVPALTVMANALTRIVSAASRLVSSLFGTTAQASAEAAENLYNETEALEGVGSAAEEASGSLAGFDEINQISSDSSSAAGFGSSSAATAPDFYGLVNDELSAIAELFTGVFLLALGAIFTFSGAHILLGLGLMVIGALAVWDAVSTNWGAIASYLQGSIGLIFGIVSGALLAIGAILVFSGASIPLGLGLMIAGAIGLAATVATNWDSIIAALQGPMGKLVAMISGALLVIGVILAFSGVQIGLGIGLMIAGAAGLAATAAVNWDSIITALQGPIGELVAIISGVLLVLGAVLTFSGAAIGLGIGLMVAGAAGLAAVAAVNWDSIVTALQGPVGKIVAIVSAALLVLGVILLFTGAGIPLGLGLIAAGAAGLAVAIIPNWDFIADAVKNAWNNVKNWWTTHAQKYFTLDYWMGVGKNILNGLLDGLKSIWGKITSWVSDAVDWITGSFTGAKSTVSKSYSSTRPNQPNTLTRSASLSSAAHALSNLPRLAAGAVIPPNREFMAVLGDQTRGNNIEAPESLIRQIVREESGGMTAELLQQILAAIQAGQVIKVNETVLGRTSAKAINKITRSSGKSVLLY